MDKRPYILHQMKPRKNTGPTITSITCYNSYPLGDYNIRRFSTSPLWILDYSWTTSIPVRIGNERRPWHIREANTAYLHPPNTVFWEDHTAAKPGMAGASLLLSGLEAAGIDKLIPKGQYYARFYDTNGKLGKILKELAQLPIKFGDNCFPAVQSSMWAIFHLLLMSRYIKNEDFIIEDIHNQENQETFSMLVENYMKEHYRKKLSLDSISNALNVSSSSLRSKFRSEQKTSPMTRLSEIRIDIAKSRLLRGEKICDIATQIGFYDEFHLSKTFKKITGHSPREFINKIHKKHT